MIYYGARVKLFRDYCPVTRDWYDSQCKGSEGTVVSKQTWIDELYDMREGARQAQFVYVKWDNGHRNAYKFGSLIPLGNPNIVIRYNDMIQASEVYGKGIGREE